MKMVVDINGDGSGGTYPSRQGAGIETFCPPNLPFGGGGSTKLFVVDSLGFLSQGLLIGKGGKVGGGPWGTHPLWVWPGWALCPPRVWPPWCPPPSCL